RFLTILKSGFKSVKTKYILNPESRRTQNYLRTFGQGPFPELLDQSSFGFKNGGGHLNNRAHRLVVTVGKLVQSSIFLHRELLSRSLAGRQLFHYSISV